jgi:hypothetical protein
MNEHTHVQVEALAPANAVTAAALPAPAADPFTQLVAVAFGRVDMTVTVSGRPLAQGDIYLRHWPVTEGPAARAAALRAVSDMPRAGVELFGDGRHVLVPDGPRVAWGGQKSSSGLTLGTLVVGDDSVARLFHDGHHRPLVIGRGMYVVRRQRNVAPIPEPAALPQPESDDSWTYG